MKSFVRNQLIEMLATISDAIKQIKQTDADTASVLLTDCGDAFIAIAGALADELSDGRYLEYEKLINNILEQLENVAAAYSQNKSVSAPSAELKNYIGTLRRELQTESEVKREIVFLPYNASMWDSLESIWKAASADPDCECYVIPIPYYERNPDFSLGKRHYEIDRFPENVPVFDYREYDFALRRPDVIYIHNPYDDANLVTSVEPAFYSRYLVKYTDMLVYVPYFITTEVMPEHFTQLPGVQNAHRVIVQSEEIAQIYRKFNNPNKILALGSPKVDKVVEMSNNPPEPLEEWKEIIRGRKTVMYNTTLTSFLQYNEKFIEKIRYVISCFEKRQDELVLIWRPHPLSEETTKSMRPQLLREYYELVNEYKAKKIGVYDDTPDFHLAMAISDAYIGGGSSLDYLFGVTGKPVMLQNVDIVRDLTEEELGELWFRDIVVDGSEAWFVATDFNGLYKLDLNTGDAEFVCRIPLYSENCTNLSPAIEKLGDTLFIAPGNADYIFEYHIIARQWERVEPVRSKLSCRYISIVKHAEKLFFIAETNDDIVEYDSNSGRYSHHVSWYTKIKHLIKPNSAAIIARGYAVIGDYIYLLLYMSNIIMRFDTKTGEVKTFTIGSNDSVYRTIVGDNENVYLISVERLEFIRWNPATNTTEIFSVNPETLSNQQGKRSPYYLLVSCPGKLIAFPDTADKAMSLNKVSGIISEFTDIPAFDNTQHPHYPYFSANCLLAKICGDFIYVLQSYSGPLLKINKITGEMLTIYLKYDREQIINSCSVVMPELRSSTYNSFQDFTTQETIVLNGFRHFLNYVSAARKRAESQTESFSTLFSNPDGDSGKLIHAHIKTTISR